MAKPKKKYSDLSIIEKNLIKKKLGITTIQDIDIAILKQLKENLKLTKDTRYKHKITYKLWDVIMCVILASFAQDKNTTKNKKALLNLEIIHKFVLACLERVKGRYNKSLRCIRKHLSNNFEEFLPELVAYLLVN